MGRPSNESKAWALALNLTPEQMAECFGPLRQYWQRVNRREREAAALQRARRKSSDRKRKKCRCEAYPWPHRPGGGLCRWPDPPVERYQPKPAAPPADGDVIARRPYAKRYAGLLRQIARANGLHPIRDRAAIEAVMPGVLVLAKQLHGQHPKVKYRNMEITEAGGVRGYWTTAGPTM